MDQSVSARLWSKVLYQNNSQLHLLNSKYFGTYYPWLSIKYDSILVAADWVWRRRCREKRERVSKSVILCCIDISGECRSSSFLKLSSYGSRGVWRWRGAGGKAFLSLCLLATPKPRPLSLFKKYLDARGPWPLGPTRPHALYRSVARDLVFSFSISFIRQMAT